MQGEAAYVHATAFLIGDIGLLATGASGTGKSSLFSELRMRLGATVRLVGDDRVQLLARGDRVVASAHPAIAGLVEHRGSGILHIECEPTAIVRGVIRIVPEAPERLPEARFPTVSVAGIQISSLVLATGSGATDRFLTIWPYFRAHLVSSLIKC